MVCILLHILILYEVKVWKNKEDMQNLQIDTENLYSNGSNGTTVRNVI